MQIRPTHGGPKSRLRDKTHPITKDLPDFWMHAKDECYSHLRGPGENMTILATAAMRVRCCRCWAGR